MWKTHRERERNILPFCCWKDKLCVRLPRQKNIKYETSIDGGVRDSEWSSYELSQHWNVKGYFYCITKAIVINLHSLLNHLTLQTACVESSSRVLLCADYQRSYLCVKEWIKKNLYGSIKWHVSLSTCSKL